MIPKIIATSGDESLVSVDRRLGMDRLVSILFPDGTVGDAIPLYSLLKRRPDFMPVLEERA
jgi:hypothetical protein